MLLLNWSCLTFTYNEKDKNEHYYEYIFKDIKKSFDLIPNGKIIFVPNYTLLKHIKETLETIFKFDLFVEE